MLRKDYLMGFLFLWGRCGRIRKIIAMKKINKSATERYLTKWSTLYFAAIVCMVISVCMSPLLLYHFGKRGLISIAVFIVCLVLSNFFLKKSEQKNLSGWEVFSFLNYSLFPPHAAERRDLRGPRSFRPARHTLLYQYWFGSFHRSR